MWHSKIGEAKAVSVAEHLAEGCSLKGTARLVRVDPSTVRRLNAKVGRHGQLFHEQAVQAVTVTELQADGGVFTANDMALPAASNSRPGKQS